MAALPTAPQVSVAVIGFAPHPWKPPGGGCGVFSTLTPSCTTEGETPARPHQAPGSAESLGQGAAAVGSSWWVLGDGGREGEKGHGENHPVGTRQLWEAEPVHGEHHQLLPQGKGHQALPPAQPGSAKPPDLCCFSLFSSRCLTAENARSGPLSQRAGSGNKLPFPRKGFRVSVWFGWRVSSTEETRHSRQGAPMGVQPPYVGTMEVQGSRDLACWQVQRWEGAVRADLGAQGSSAHSRMAPSQPPQRPLPQHPCFGLGKGLVFIPNSRDLSSRQARGYLRLLSCSSDPHVSLKGIKKSSNSE